MKTSKNYHLQVKTIQEHNLSIDTVPIPTAAEVTYNLMETTKRQQIESGPHFVGPSIKPYILRLRYIENWR